MTHLGLEMLSREIINLRIDIRDLRKECKLFPAAKSMLKGRITAALLLGAGSSALP